MINYICMYVCRITVLSLDLLTSVTNPFASYSGNMRRYHACIWIASFASAVRYRPIHTYIHTLTVQCSPYPCIQHHQPPKPAYLPRSVSVQRNLLDSNIESCRQPLYMGILSSVGFHLLHHICCSDRVCLHENHERSGENIHHPLPVCARHLLVCGALLRIRLRGGPIVFHHRLRAPQKLGRGFESNGECLCVCDRLQGMLRFPHLVLLT